MISHTSHFGWMFRTASALRLWFGASASVLSSRRRFGVRARRGINVRAFDFHSVGLFSSERALRRPRGVGTHDSPRRAVRPMESEGFGLWCRRVALRRCARPGIMLQAGFRGFSNDLHGGVLRYRANVISAASATEISSSCRLWASGGRACSVRGLAGSFGEGPSRFRPG